MVKIKPFFNIYGSRTRVLRSLFLPIGIFFGAFTPSYLVAPIFKHASQAQGFESFISEPLTLVTRTGRHDFTVDIAINDAQRSQGLMFRQALAPDRGMLFIYPSDRIISMWMKNTLIPLDIVFIGNDGRVVSVYERAVPGSLKVISSGARASAVLELSGGSATRLWIQPGDHVINLRLGTT